MGVEAYGDEWSFAFYTDAGEDLSVSGCARNSPRDNQSFDYKYPIYMGRTKKTSLEASRIFLELMDKWPSAQYHITENNCVDFAMEVVKLLEVPRPFPKKVRGFLDLSA